MNEADKRIPVRADSLEELRDFAYGLKGTYDDAIRVLLAIAKQNGESALDAGRRIGEQREQTGEKNVAP